MSRKERLNARLLRLQNKKNQLDARCKASTDVNEVRSLTEQLEDVNADIADVQAEIEEIETEERAAAQADTAEKRGMPPVGAHPLEGRAASGAPVGEDDA